MDVTKKVMGRALIDVVFSWSIRDVLNKNLYESRVEEIPKHFSSIQGYMSSFKNPLIEETHADLCSSMQALSRAPTCQIVDVQPSREFKHPKDLFYNVVLKRSTVTFNVEGYEPEMRDLIAFTEITRPKCIDDINKPTRPYMVAVVQKPRAKDSDKVKILASKPLLFEKTKKETLFAVYLTNLTTNIRIWASLNSDLNGGDLKILKTLLRRDTIASDVCFPCSFDDSSDVICKSLKTIQPFGLDGSQKSAIKTCLATRDCRHLNIVKLIWGPPGTGKTKTLACLLYILLKVSCRTLTCAPTNVAVIEVTQRLLNVVRESSNFDSCRLGDIVLFGNGERMRIDDHDDLDNLFLDNRLSVLACCFQSSTGWKSSLDSMISLLEDHEGQYNLYLGNEKQGDDSDDYQAVREYDEEEGSETNNLWTFSELFMKSFKSVKERLIFCFTTLYTHLPTKIISLDTGKRMIQSIKLLQSIGSLIDERLKLEMAKYECLQELIYLRETLSVQRVLSLTDPSLIRRLCLQNAQLLFCTASSSTKLHTKGMLPIEMLIIDEAAQLKECESTIPLQLPGLRHAILIGDEKQLPATVQSEICTEAQFGRSLFERLVLLGQQKQLLRVQYRMHPSISLFPNREFYGMQILDGQNVKERAFQQHFLQEIMFDTYSFINVTHGREEFGEGHSKKNIVEAFLVAEIVAKLHQASIHNKRRLSVGCISPYKAQVSAIKEILGQKYGTEADGDFYVNVRSVDGFQGGEEDVIIISTVRCNESGSIGFLENWQRANVALTRARYCLWILGNGATLVNSGTVWKNLVNDASERGCFYDAVKDEKLAETIKEALIRSGNLINLLHQDSLLFRTAKWKVHFYCDFMSSISRIRSDETVKEVCDLLTKIASGWRRESRNLNNLVGTNGDSTADLFEMYEVDGRLNLIWMVDLAIENSICTQVLKIWDILSLAKSSMRITQLAVIIGNYSVDQMKCCKFKRFEGDLVIPETWHLERQAATGRSRCPMERLALLSLNDNTESSTSSSSIQGSLTCSRGQEGSIRRGTWR